MRKSSVESRGVYGIEEEKRTVRWRGGKRKGERVILVLVFYTNTRTSMAVDLTTLTRICHCISYKVFARNRQRSVLNYLLSTIILLDIGVVIVDQPG